MKATEMVTIPKENFKMVLDDAATAYEYLMVEYLIYWHNSVTDLDPVSGNVTADPVVADEVFSVEKVIQYFGTPYQISRLDPVGD
jgi:hypothetical protein